MRLAFDLDGVLADLESALQREANRLFSEGTLASGATDDGRKQQIPDGGRSLLPQSDADATEPAPAADGESVSAVALPSLTPRQNAILWREVRGITNFWETLGEVEEGATRRLASLARERRWDVVFLTSRPSTDGDTVQVQTQRWLEQKGFPLPSTLVVDGSRGKIASALELDVVVDDRPENCLDVVAESQARAILIWPGGESTVPANARRLQIGCVSGARACLDLLAEAEPSGQPKTGLAARLRQLLRLSVPPRRAAARH